MGDGEEEEVTPEVTPEVPPPEPQSQPLPLSSTPPPKFDPSRMIGIIRRKALIKDLAAAYHAECLDYCQELLELQKKWEEQIHALVDAKALEDSKKDLMKPSKRAKRAR